MNLIFFAAWVVAGAVLILPLGMFVRLGRRLTGRGRGGPRSTAPAATAPVLEAAGASPNPGSLEAEEPGLTAAAAPEKAARPSSRSLPQRLAPVVSFLLYVAFIAGAVYYVPQILSWALDTPHPMAAVSSQSMWPALRKGDLIFLRGVDKVEELEIGDIIAYQHRKGITVHRVVEIDGDIITTMGDANPVEDSPIPFDQVVGRVVAVGGHLLRVPQVGSIASLFGSLAAPAGQSPDEQAQPEELRAAAPPEGVDDASRVDVSSGTTSLVSVKSDGRQADGPSSRPAISADGRFVAFVSAASNLAPGLKDGQSDVFVHDRLGGRTQRVSVNSAGNRANGSSDTPAISADGRFVAFVSEASNLVPGDTNGASDVFVHDRQTGVTGRVSVDSDGRQVGGGTGAPAISGDGRFVAFESAASNLVSGDSNGESDVFVHDRETGITERVSVGNDGNQGNGGSSKAVISADGRFVAFQSDARNLVTGDSNGASDVFVHDRQTVATERVSVSSDAVEGNDGSHSPSISADGQLVAFASKATNLVGRDYNRDQDIFVHDRETGKTERVSVTSRGKQSSASASAPSISGDGRLVAFQASEGNLVVDDNNRRLDVFVHDRATGLTEQVSVDSAGNQGNDHSSAPAISADGRIIAFASWSGNLVPGDVNGSQDVFVRDRGPAGGGQ